MKFNNLRIGYKLFVGFSSVLFFVLVVGAIAISSINEITYQLEISKEVNRALVDAGDAQANALRLIIYEDSKYMDGMDEEIVNVKEMAGKAKELMKSDENKANAEKIITAITEYEQASDQWWALEQKKDAAGVTRAAAAKTVLNNIIKVNSAAQSFSLDQSSEVASVAMIDKAAAQRAYFSQQCRDAFNRVRVAAQKYQLAKQPDAQDACAITWMSDINEVRSLLTKALAMMKSEGTKTAINAAQGALNDYEAQVMVFRKINLEQRDIQKSQKAHAAEAMTNCRTVRDGVYGFIEETESSVFTYVISGIVISVILAILIATFITKGITTPSGFLCELLNVLAGKTNQMADIYQNKLAKGDWTVKADIQMEEKFKQVMGTNAERADEIGDMSKACAKIFDAIALASEGTNECIAQVSETLGEVSSSVEQVGSGAHQISSASQSLSQGATEQAASMEEISSSMNQIASQTRINAENATQANMLSTSANDAAVTGKEQMKALSTAIGDITKQAEDVQKINKVIDDIAFQTNLLALNAAVEAARAGRHGKGFAVVAEEVRNLAARSAKAANETSELISGVVDKIRDGNEMAHKTAEGLENITTQVSKATDLVGEIAVASNEQAQAVAQINTALSQIDAVTQQNTANAEETASSAEEMSSQTVILEGMVGRFKLSNTHIETQAYSPSPVAGSKAYSSSPVAASQAYSSAPITKAPKPAHTPDPVKTSDWGGGGSSTSTAEPEIFLDDSEFGKF